MAKGLSPSGDDVSDRPYGDAIPRRRLATIRSRFSDIVVDESDDARYLWFGYSRQAGVRRDHGALDFRMALASSQRCLDIADLYGPKPESVLHVGLGAGNSPMRDMLRYPQAQVEVVELDPMVLNVAREWFGFDLGRCHVHLSDARAFLQSMDRRWDRIVLDAFLSAGGTSELNVLPVYFSERAFISLVENRVTERGVLVANVNGALRGVESAPLLALLESIEEIFGHIAVHSVADRSGDDIAPWKHPDLELTDEHYIVIASRQHLPTFDELVRRAIAAEGSDYVDAEIVTYARSRIDAWRADPPRST